MTQTNRLKSSLGLLAIVALVGAIYVGINSTTLRSADAKVSTGEEAPAVSFTTVEGVEANLSDFKGKIVVLEWHNPQCPFVKKFYKNGDMQGLQSEALEMSEDIVWIAVNSGAEGKQGFVESDEEALAMLEEDGFNVSHYVRDTTGEFGQAFGAQTTPHMFVLNKDGQIAYQGAIDSKSSADPADIADANNYVMNTLNALVNGQELATTETAPYGCGVKY